MTGLDYLVLGLYLLLMLGMGWRIARRQESTEDFFVGGRNLPSWAVGISLFASLLSTITYLGMPGEMFRTGLAFLTRQLPIPLVLLVVWLLWIPFFMRLNLTSAYEYLERRFNYQIRAWAAVFCLLLLFGWMAVVVLTASNAMLQITQMDLSGLVGADAAEDAAMYAIILGIGLFSVIYTTMGGIRAVVWTDVIQFVVLMGGAFFTMAYIAINTGTGIGDWIETSQQFKHEDVEWFSGDLSNRSTVFSISLGMFFWFVCTHGANQVALQRYFTVGSVKEARNSYLVSAIVTIIIGVTLAGVGISLMSFIQDHEVPAKAELQEQVDEAGAKRGAADKIFPQFISIYLPAGLRGLVVAALFAAAMSTIDSGANSVSTIVTVDFLRRNQQQDVSPEAELRRARMMTATMGFVVVAYSVGLYHASKGSDIISLMQKGFNCYLGPLGAVFVLGMFSRKVTAKVLLPAFLIGEVVGVVSSYSVELFAREFSTHLVIPTALLTTIVLAHVFAMVGRTEVTPAQQQMLWWRVVQTQELRTDEDVKTA